VSGRYAQPYSVGGSSDAAFLLSVLQHSFALVFAYMHMYFDVSRF